MQNTINVIYSTLFNLISTDLGVFCKYGEGVPERIPSINLNMFMIDEPVLLNNLEYIDVIIPVQIIDAGYDEAVSRSMSSLYLLFRRLVLNRFLIQMRDNGLSINELEFGDFRPDMDIAENYSVLAGQIRVQVFVDMR